MSTQPSETTLDIARAIRDLRLHLGKSQQAFAGLLDASINSIAKYELGTMKPGHDRLGRCLNLAVEAGDTAAADTFRRELMVDCYVAFRDTLQTLSYHVPQIDIDLDEITGDGDSSLSPLALGRVSSIKKHLQSILSLLAQMGQKAHGDVP